MPNPDGPVSDDPTPDDLTPEAGPASGASQRRGGMVDQSQSHASGSLRGGALTFGPIKLGFGAGLLLCALLLAPPIFARSIWVPDEARYAEVARSMRANASYWNMTLNGERYAEKPPLFFWLANAVHALRGAPAERATRWVSVIASIATCLLTAIFAAWLFGGEAAFLSLAVLLTANYFAYLGQLGNLDSLLTLFTTASVMLIWRAETGPQERRGAWLAGAYVIAGLGMLTKGPVGYLIPAFAALAIRSQRHGWRRMPAWHLLWGAGVAAAMIGLWLLPASIAEGPDFLYRMVVTQTVGRTVNSWKHVEPLYFYLIHFPLDFLPWIFWLPGAFVFAWRAKGERRLAARSLAWWFVAGFVFFSALSGKRARYLLVLYPAAAILIGAYLSDCLSASAKGEGAAQGTLRTKGRAIWPRRLASAAGLGVASLMAAAPVAILLFAVTPLASLVSTPGTPMAAFLERLDGGDALLALIWAAAAVFAVGRGWKSFQANSPRGVIQGVLAAASLAVLFTPWAIYRNGMPYQPLPELRRHLQATQGAGELWLYRRDFNGVVNLAVNAAPLRVLGGTDELDEALEAGIPFRIVMRTKTLLRLPDSLRERVIEAARIGTRKRGMSILVPKPPEPPERPSGGS